MPSYCAEYALFWTWNSCTASSEGVMVGVPNPGSVLARPSILNVMDDGLVPEIENDPPLSSRNAGALPPAGAVTVELSAMKS